MKRSIIFATILTSFLCFTVQAQVSSTTYFKVKDVGNATMVEWSFTLDSLTALASPTFNLDDGAYDFQSQPITFYKKTVSTYGVPILDVYLQDVGFTTTDTMTVDTLCSQSIGETDSLGTSKPSTVTTAGNQPAMGMMKIFARALNVDINAGKIRIIFPKRGR